MDIQEIIDCSEYLEIARSFFEPEEVKNIEESNSKELFFQYWSAKEAYLKAIGVGLLKAWNVVVVRQPALRTIIDVKAMKQKILTRVQDYKIELLDFEEDLKGFYELRRDMEDQVLDISRWPVFDIRVSKLKDKFRIHVSMDNMILDGTAICAVLDEWNKLYKGEVLKSDIGKKTFKDYVNYLKTLELSSEYSMAQEYWNKKIVNMPPRPELPLLNKNVNGEFYRLSTVLQKEKWNVLKMLSAKYGITPSNVLLTSFSEVLYRWGKENKFTINLTINKKALLDSGYAKVLGEFTDTILVEVNAGKKRNFIEKCKSIQNELLNNLKYSSYNGVAVQRDWTKEHGFLMGTAFPIVFTSLLGTADLLDMPGKISYGLTQTPQVWLDYQVSEIAGKLYLNWDVLRGKYDDGVIAQMFSCYLDSLEKMTDRRFWETPQKNHIGNFQSSLPKEDRDATLIKEESLYKMLSTSTRKMMAEIPINLDKIGETLGVEKKWYIEQPSSSLQHLFTEIYEAKGCRHVGYFKIKAIELLYYMEQLTQINSCDFKYFDKRQIEATKAIRDYLIGHLDEKISLECLAKEAHLNLTVFHNIFFHIYGDTPYAYLKKYKMNLAAKLLLDGKRKIGDIALELGYNNASKFTKAFQSVYGVLPKDYRKNK